MSTVPAPGKNAGGNILIWLAENQRLPLDTLIRALFRAGHKAASISAGIQAYIAAKE